jgi:hypothetical protein
MKRFTAYFRANMGFEFYSLGGQVEAWGAVEAVAIEQGHGGHLLLGANGDQVLGQGSALEEAEGGTGVEFDVHRAIWSSDHRAIEINHPMIRWLDHPISHTFPLRTIAR